MSTAAAINVSTASHSALPARRSTGAKKPRAKKSGAGGTAPHSHPPYSSMIKQAIKNLKDKKGSSRAAILKYLASNYKVGGNIVAVNAHLRLALKRGVSTGMLKQVKGVGASGSFRLADTKSDSVKKPRAKKAKVASRKSGTTKPKTPKVKRTSTATKKSKVQKSATKASPKKLMSRAKKPKAARKSKSSPKKHMKKATKH